MSPAADLRQPYKPAPGSPEYSATPAHLRTSDADPAPVTATTTPAAVRKLAPLALESKYDDVTPLMVSSAAEDVKHQRVQTACVKWLRKGITHDPWICATPRVLSFADNLNNPWLPRFEQFDMSVDLTDVVVSLSMSVIQCASKFVCLTDSFFLNHARPGIVRQLTKMRRQQPDIKWLIVPVNAASKNKRFKGHWAVLVVDCALQQRSVLFDSRLTVAMVEHIKKNATPLFEAITEVFGSKMKPCVSDIFCAPVRSQAGTTECGYHAILCMLYAACKLETVAGVDMSIFTADNTQAQLQLPLGLWFMTQWAGLMFDFLKQLAVRKLVNKTHLDQMQLSQLEPLFAMNGKFGPQSSSSSSSSSTAATTAPAAAISASPPIPRLEAIRDKSQPAASTVVAAAKPITLVDAATKLKLRRTTSTVRKCNRCSEGITNPQHLRKCSGDNCSNFCHEVHVSDQARTAHITHQHTHTRIAFAGMSAAIRVRACGSSGRPVFASRGGLLRRGLCDRLDQPLERRAQSNQRRCRQDRCLGAPVECG